MVVIPARNEAPLVARAVRSLPPDTVIVVDDHSEDKTAELARDAGAGVVPAPPLPPRNLGKPSACASGAQVLSSRWILFADADTHFAPGFLPAVVATAETSGLSLLSLLLEPEYETLAERILAPYARALFFCGVNPHRSPKAAFSGQCVLARRDAYVFMGGHGAVASQLCEDVRLAGLAERHRLKYAIAHGNRLGYARMYPGWSGIAGGIERHAFRFTLVNPALGLSIIAATLLSALWLPEIIWLLRGRHGIVAIWFVLVPFALLRPWYGSWRKALAAPLAIYGLLPVILRAAVSAARGKRIVWKGRTI